MILKTYLFYSILGTLIASKFAYKKPKVTLEKLQNGFRLSIPNDDGIMSVTYNANRNVQFERYTPGEFSTEVMTPIDDRWVFDVKQQLLDDDIIHVWINVVYEKFSYRNLEDPIKVAELKYQSTSRPRPRPIPTSSPLTYGGQAAAPITNRGVTTATPQPAIAPILSNCIQSMTIVNNRRACAGELLFEENFDNFINPGRWQTEVRFPLEADDAEFVVYDQIAKVQNGALSIVPRLWNNDEPGTRINRGELDLGTKCTGNVDRNQECIRKTQGLAYILPPIISARINTKNSFSFKYGRIDIRAKLPQGDWLFPILALEPLRKSYGAVEYASGQMRVAFARGNRNLKLEDGTFIDGRRLYGGAILTTNVTYRENSLVSTFQNNHFGNDFHIYSLIWTEDALTFEVDGKEYGKITGEFNSKYPNAWESVSSWKEGGKMAPLDQEFYIALGVGAGGHADFPDNTVSNNNEKPWLNTSPRGTIRFWRNRRMWKPTWIDPELQVDYVRVWALE